MVLASARETALPAQDVIARKSKILHDTENCSTIDGIRDAHMTNTCTQGISPSIRFNGLMGAL